MYQPVPKTYALEGLSCQSDQKHLTKLVFWMEMVLCKALNDTETFNLICIVVAVTSGFQPKRNFATVSYLFSAFETTIVCWGCEASPYQNYLVYHG